ncbi:Rv3235 family protein [Actinokineospora sp. UTMC 2448]|uniref:Rv3235 family protein n=1 Tax=Actinokineospora sp. UTMC 2448 TaxID=2268449 RepID=UPI0021643DD3|nr:Rv3235 family protein [Actinokineospora sp. UTMC 2448]UVS76535.1 hypothetical protein Actkin_00226 [Actinokineospora sp. UTMC 2448]
MLTTLPTPTSHANHPARPAQPAQPEPAPLPEPARPQCTALSEQPARPQPTPLPAPTEYPESPALPNHTPPPIGPTSPAARRPHFLRRCPPPHHHLTRLVTALVETMAGRRGPNQLAPHLTYPAQTALRVLPRQPRTLRLRSVHVCQVHPTAVEVAATLDTPTRAKALAARLEHTTRGWQVTALHLIGG